MLSLAKALLALGSAPANRKGPKSKSTGNSGEKRGRIENLKPFQPGQSGNPSGRPKALFSDAYMRVLERQIPNDAKGRLFIDAVAERVVALAVQGDIRAVMELADRLQGKAMQGVQVAGPGGGAIPLTSFTPEENEKRIAELLAQAGMAVVPIRGTES
jgi:Family of unknown function (DUF5681)